MHFQDSFSIQNSPIQGGGNIPPGVMGGNISTAFLCRKRRWECTEGLPREPQRHLCGLGKGWIRRGGRLDFLNRDSGSVSQVFVLRFEQRKELGDRRFGQRAKISQSFDCGFRHSILWIIHVADEQWDNRVWFAADLS